MYEDILIGIGIGGRAGLNVELVEESLEEIKTQQVDVRFVIGTFYRHATKK